MNNIFEDLFDWRHHDCAHDMDHPGLRSALALIDADNDGFLTRSEIRAYTAKVILR
jgi:hypothetical protein